MAPELQSLLGLKPCPEFTVMDFTNTLHGFNSK